MSYILDAIKKSEQQRQQEKTVPELQQSPSKPPAIKKENRKAPKWLIGLIFVPFAVMIGYVTYSLLHQFDGGDNLVEAVSPAEEVKNTVPATSGKDATKGLSPVESSENSLQAPEQQTGENRRSPDPATEKQVKISELMVMEENTEILQPTPIVTGKLENAEKKQVQPLPPPKYASVPFLEELAPSFRETIPKLNLAGHVYSPDPELRMILINNSVVREADIVERKLILDEITPNGIVLRSGETRFRLLAN